LNKEKKAIEKELTLEEIDEYLHELAKAKPILPIVCPYCGSIRKITSVKNGNERIYICKVCHKTWRGRDEEK